MKRIAPVLVLSTGRCGSTMISDILNRHPKILSLSEVFSTLGVWALSRKRLNGKAVWEMCRRQHRSLRALLSAHELASEILYPFDSPQARFTPDNVPPILCTALPHLTPHFESLYDELQPVVRARPKAALADQYRFLFEWLCERHGRTLWVERSGGSLMFAPRLIPLFPEARIIHIYRDGRDTALSMSQHPAFRIMLATMQKLERAGVRPLDSTARAGPVASALALLLLLLANPRKVVRREFDLEAFGDLWSRIILRGQKLLAAVPTDRFLALRYEDILQRPHDKLRELIDFIDPSLADDGWLAAAVSIPRPNPPKYLSLDADTQWRLTRVCAPGLKALGYATQGMGG